MKESANEYTAMQKELYDVTAQYTKVKADYDNGVDENVKLRNEISKFKSDHEKAITRLNILNKEELAKANSKMEFHEIKLREKDKSINSLKLDVDKGLLDKKLLKDQLKKLNEDFVRLTDKSSKLDKSNNEYLEQISLLKTEIQQLKEAQEREKDQNVFSSVENEMKLKEENERLNREILAMTEELEKLKTKEETNANKTEESQLINQEKYQTIKSEFEMKISQLEQNIEKYSEINKQQKSMLISNEEEVNELK